MRAIRVQPALLRALLQLHKEPFSVASLTQAYQTQENHPHSSYKAARQFVYRNMLRLMSAGWLEKLANQKGWPQYRTTETFISSLPSNLLNTTTEQSPTRSAVSAIPPAVNVLQRRLSQHKSEMLCAMGEAEEYSELCEEHPELRTQAQALYNQARDRSALLLGKVKALESLLAQQAQS